MNHLKHKSDTEKNLSIFMVAVLVAILLFLGWYFSQIEPNINQKTTNTKDTKNIKIIEKEIIREVTGKPTPESSSTPFIKFR